MKHYALGRLKAGLKNRTETAYEHLLSKRLQDGDILWFKFEGMKLKLADNTFYTPDFSIMTKDLQIEIHEVKGARAIFMDDAKVKIKVAAENYPFVFRVAFPRAKKDGGGWDIEQVGRV